MTNEIMVIGAGRHGRANIYPAISEAGGKIVAVCTLEMETSLHTIAECGLKAKGYDNVTAMLKQESCKNVAVVAQANDAVVIVKQCLNAGKNVFVEKPLGLSVSDAVEIADLARSKGVFVMVGFMKRHAPIYKKINETITSNIYGKVCAFNAVMAVDATSWNDSEKGFVYYVIVHYLDLIRHLFGEVESLTGHKQGDGKNALSQSVSVRMANGAVGSIMFINNGSWSRENEQLTVTFENGFVFADNLMQLTMHSSHNTSSEMPWAKLCEADRVYTPNTSPASGATRDLYLRGFAHEFEHFFNCCKNGSQPLSNADDNINTVKLCEQILAIN